MKVKVCPFHKAIKLVPYPRMDVYGKKTGEKVYACPICDYVEDAKGEWQWF